MRRSACIEFSSVPGRRRRSRPFISLKLEPHVGTARVAHGENRVSTPGNTPEQTGNTAPMSGFRPAPSRLARMSTSPELAAVPSPRELAEKYGLSKSSVRPALGDYVRDLWGGRELC